MRTRNPWLIGVGIAAAAIGGALLFGGLGFADWGDEPSYPGPFGMGMGPAYGLGGCPMWGEGRWAGPKMQSQLELDTVKDLATRYIARYGDSLEIAEIMEFSNHAYVEVKETDTGMGAMELLVWPDGRVTPEPGPNMMWNLKYGHMSGMMGAARDYATDMPISSEEALVIAQGYLDQRAPGTVAAPEADAFYGYYTVHVLRDGRVVGMLSVNGFTGQVWYHSWHGEFLEMEEVDHEG